MLKKIFNSHAREKIIGRPLTNNEKALARSVFGDKIDYSGIKIFFRPYGFLLGSKTRSMSPNGNIYFGTQYKDLNDMCQSPQSRALFIHEMTHVWQYQNDKFFQAKGLVFVLRNAFNYDRTYKYELDKIKNFKSLNIEQQASLIEHYYAICEKNKISQNPDLTNRKKRYEQILQDNIPGRL
jgi:type VI secretion system secreted protein VgrG